MNLVCYRILRSKSWLIQIISFICLVAYIAYIHLPTLTIHIDITSSLRTGQEKRHFQTTYLCNESLGVYLVTSTNGLHKDIGITNSSKTYNRISLEAYLVPLTKGLQRKELNDSVSEDILRSGLGLQPFRTEKNEDIWIENGVQYRPFPFLEKKDNSLYTSEFEAYIPFNMSLFFEGGGGGSNINVTDKKIILWWQHKIAHAPIDGLNPLRACPDFPCVLTSDRKYTDKSSALLVNEKSEIFFKVPETIMSNVHESYRYYVIAHHAHPYRPITNMYCSILSTGAYMRKKLHFSSQALIKIPSVNGYKEYLGERSFEYVAPSLWNSNTPALRISQFVNGEVPPRRREDQVLINYQIESPFNYWFYGNLFEAGKEWNRAFNWTMSYRIDADITTYHGLVRKRRVAKEKDYEAILAKKKGLVAWMVSHCETNSKRESYVKELQKYIQVDIYGQCGQFQCPRISDNKCLEDINVKYKFYFGFESNLCRDYITEKLYRYLDSDMIVIARGFNTYSRLLPSEIFINTADFNSTKDLANWLLYLNSNDQEYTKMLREKDKYFSLYEDYPLLGDKQPFMEYRFESVPMCEVCRRVWNLQNYAKVYPDMSEWMHKEDYQCVSPTDL